ncbi:hypothetical protein QFZ48_004298 [Chitinophaga sp. W2I13]|uniref:hypothetical protein n=1 Tax=Chitinophaga sp. W2I13 TaxID=3373923 RepID=UPI003D231DBC
MVASPAGATHFKILVAAAEIDFETETFVNGNAASVEIAIDATETEDMNLIQCSS